jgi:hypothetical protein
VVWQHFRLPLSIGIILGTDGVAGKSVFLDDVRSALGTLADDQRGIIGHCDRTDDKSNKTSNCQHDSCFHNTLLFLPGIVVLAVLGK